MDSTVVLIIAIAVYVVILMVIGYYSTQQTKSTEDFLVAGRQLGVWVVAFATSASILSGWSFVGSSGLMYKTGWALNVGIVLAGSGFGIPLCYIIGAKPMRLISHKYSVYTVPDALYTIYKSRPLAALSSLGILAGTVGYLTVQWVALAYIISIAFGTQYIWGLMAAIIIVGLYVVGGGALSSAYADFFQQIIMIAVAIFVPTIAINTVGGFTEMNAKLAEITTKFVTYPGVTPWGYTIFFSFMFIFTMWSPHIVNKFYSAKNLKVLQWGALICGVTFIFCSLVSVTGAAGKVAVTQGLMQAPEKADEILPLFIRTFFSPVTMGIMLAAVLAATMSTIAAFLVVGSSAVVRDLWKHTFGKQMEAKKELFWLRVFTALIVVATGLLAINPPKLLALIGAAAFGMFVCTIAPQMILGLRWKRASAPAAVAATAVGLLLSVALFVYDALFSITFFKTIHLGGFSVAAVFAVMIIGSYMTPYKEKEIFKDFKSSSETEVTTVS